MLAQGRDKDLVCQESPGVGKAQPLLWVLLSYVPTSGAPCLSDSMDFKASTKQILLSLQPLPVTTHHPNHYSDFYHHKWVLPIFELYITHFCLAFFFLLNIMPVKFILLFHVAIVCLFSLLYTISLYECTIIYLSILLLRDIGLFPVWGYNEQWSWGTFESFSRV